MITLHIGWGESPEDEAKSSQYAFKTQAEVRAFLLGIQEMDGWAGWSVVDEPSICRNGEWVPESYVQCAACEAWHAPQDMCKACMSKGDALYEDMKGW